jgi:hypothetical protein
MSILPKSSNIALEPNLPEVMSIMTAHSADLLVISFLKKKVSPHQLSVFSHGSGGKPVKARPLKHNSAYSYMISIR